MHNSSRILILIVLIFVILAGCASLPETKRHEIHGSSVYYSNTGKSGPVVVFETGIGPTMSTWIPIYEKVSRFARVFAYDRPGYGRSNTRNTPDNITEVVENLRMLLSQTGNNPPYIIVGHSAGGLFMNAFARNYPMEVSGVVLIDSTHPHWFKFLEEEKPIAFTMLTTSTAVGRRSYESKIIQNTEKEFDTYGDFPNIPLIVLTAEKSMLFETKEIRKKWLALQEDLASMSNKSQHIIVDGSNHYIYKSNPDVVISAIRKIVEQMTE